MSSKLDNKIHDKNKRKKKIHCKLYSNKILIVCGILIFKFLKFC